MEMIEFDREEARKEFIFIKEGFKLKSQNNYTIQNKEII